MARKRYSDEDVLKILREIDVHLHDGLDVVGACRKAGISDKTYYYWRKKFGGLGRPQLSEPSTCSTPSTQVSQPQLTLPTIVHKNVYAVQLFCYGGSI